MPIDPNMLAYYASTLGQGLMNPDDPMQGVAEATKQQIATQNYMKMIKTMLAGGGKFTMDKDKFKLDAPSALLGDELFKDSVPDVAMNIPGGGQTGTQQNFLKQSFLNPSDSPLGVSSADLVGLTPENISQALQLKFAGEEVERKKLSDVLDIAYKQKVLGAKDTRTSDIKNYEYARQQGFKGSFEDFQNIAETTHKKDYDEAVKSGYKGTFNDWMLEMAKAGAINFGEIAEREIGKGLGKGQAKVMSPDFAQDVREGLAKDKANWPSESLIKKYTDKGLSYSEAEERAQKRMVLEAMDKQVRQAFKGKKVTTESDGWYVDGELKVRYP